VAKPEGYCLLGEANGSIVTLITTTWYDFASKERAKQLSTISLRL